MKRLILLFTPLIALVALVALFALNIDRDPNFIPSVLLNKPVPDVSLQMLLLDGYDNPGFAPDDFPGQVTVVNVFASWCIPCRDEHKFLVELGPEDILLYGINHKDTLENVEAFLNELGNPYDRIGEDPDGRASIEWGVYGVPETFVVNAEGIITYKHIGPLSRESFDNALMPAIRAAQAEMKK